MRKNAKIEANYEKKSLLLLTHFFQNCPKICVFSGTGAFGRVELTRHRKTGAYYALKMMNIQTIIDRKQVQHVHHEKRILQSLTHPFIVKMYDTAKDNRNLYMIMEFLSGGELFSYLRINRGFPSSTVKFLVAEVLLALEYLHGLYIVKKTLKFFSFFHLFWRFCFCLIF
jgi:serine/threonine protein kinase